MEFGASMLYHLVLCSYHNSYIRVGERTANIDAWDSEFFAGPLLASRFGEHSNCQLECTVVCRMIKTGVLTGTWASNPLFDAIVAFQLWLLEVG